MKKNLVHGSRVGRDLVMVKPFKAISILSDVKVTHNTEP